jgi:hypothetical protein
MTMDGPVVSPDVTQDSVAVIVIASIIAVGIVSVIICSCVAMYRDRREQNVMQLALLTAAPLYSAPDSVHV